MDKVDYDAKLASEVEKLKGYQRALREEHEKIVTEANNGEPLIDSTLVLKHIEQKLLKAADTAAEVVLEVLNHGDKDTTRLAAAKYVLENVKDKPSPEGDPWDKILSRITKDEVTESS